MTSKEEEDNSQPTNENKENDAEVGTVGSVGTARILNSNYYNLLIINDSNILEEKTRGVPTVPTVPT